MPHQVQADGVRSSRTCDCPVSENPSSLQCVHGRVVAFRYDARDVWRRRGYPTGDDPTAAWWRWILLLRRGAVAHGGKAPRGCLCLRLGGTGVSRSWRPRRLETQAVRWRESKKSNAMTRYFVSAALPLLVPVDWSAW